MRLATRPDERCIATDDGRRCVLAGTVDLTFGCVHEHVETNRTCDSHAATVRAALDRRDLWCQRCRASHKCRVMLLKVVPV